LTPHPSARSDTHFCANAADREFVLMEAARNGESRHKAIGFSRVGRLLAVVHTEEDGELIRIISACPATARDEGAAEWNEGDAGS
jgi:uncharacterized DUF497 family protein